MWVTQEVERGYSGHAVAMSGRSVVAGHARVWGPLAAALALASGSIGGFIAAGALVAPCTGRWPSSPKGSR